MENFVKIDGITYFESQLRLMNEGQLNHLIERCQKGIDEIAMKKTDYENCNYNESDLDHYYDVIKKFEAASVYLQSDIVLISRILKTRKNIVSVCDINNWYKQFFQESTGFVSKRKMQKIIKSVNNAVGYSINFEG